MTTLYRPILDALGPDAATEWAATHDGERVTLRAIQRVIMQDYAKRLHKSGLPVNVIAERLGINRRTVYNFLRQD